jgi:transcriptional regulator with XRE-family HTH domain
MLKISVRAARINAGFSQKEAAIRLGVSTKTIWNWENGVSFPPADKILEICELYAVPYDNLNFLPSNSLKAKD